MEEDELVARLTGAGAARRRQRLQSLWGGYGELSRYELVGARWPTVIVKSVRPPPDASSISDRRKRRSYEVEHAFYSSFAQRCGAACRVPALLGSHEEGGRRSFVLEDLDAAGFDGRRRRGSARELEACLAWLASFHATFLGAASEGLWQEGSYWQLETRRDELPRIEDEELRGAADRLDAPLRATRYRTVVHGDAKEANFCFGRRGVAAVDFQYAGGGCGIRDVAYLLHGRVDSIEEERSLVADYFRYLSVALQARGLEAAEVEREWAPLYDVAHADFNRFLAGWSPASWRADEASSARARETIRRLS